MATDKHPRDFTPEERRAAFVKEYPLTSAPIELRLAIQDAIQDISTPLDFLKRKQELWLQYPQWTKYIRIHMVQR